VKSSLEVVAMNNVMNLKLILIIDDSPENLALTSSMLYNDYRVKVANSGKRGLELAASSPKPDLILLDITMPVMDGYKVCCKLKSRAETKEIPVIFVTGLTEATDESKGLSIGAEDYITKPISNAILLARIKTHLQLKAAKDILRNQNEFLENEVEKRIHEIHIVQEVTINALASLAETRDNETGQHLKRTQNYVKAIARYIKDNGMLKEKLTEYDIEQIYKSSPLHDIGKVGIPDSILLKPGRLTDEEFEIIKKHTLIGVSAIENAEKDLDQEVDFLKYAKEIACSHHERWDGKGYPYGLKGYEIPFSGRVMAVADVYDALVSERVYKKGLSHEQAVKIIKEGCGTQFDPVIVDAFMQIQEEILKLAIAFKDKALL
jgi:putative two-component system response regulator